MGPAAQTPESDNRRAKESRRSPARWVKLYFMTAAGWLVGAVLQLARGISKEDAVTTFIGLAFLLLSAMNLRAARGYRQLQARAELNQALRRPPGPQPPVTV